MKFTSSLKLKLIYVFRINDESHKGCLKIGETTSDNEDIWGLEPNSKALNNAAKKRINQYTQTAGIRYDLLYTEVTVYNDRGTLKSFSDSEVHQVLIRSGIKKKVFDEKNKANEWFVTDLETVKKAIKAVKKGRNSIEQSEITTDKSPIIFRPEQQEAIDKTKKQFRKGNEMLWFAKMRFGKTLSALQVVKDMDFTRTLILTHRPVVDAGWFEDFGKIFYDKSNFSYGSKKNGDLIQTLETQHKKNDSKYVYFASMQDLRGSSQVGGNFNKNDEIFSANWDFIIVDEAHEGTQTELGKNVMRELVKPTTKVLQLSGTPFNLLDNYQEDEIYTWDYVMEQKAKKEWDEIHFGDPNPYALLPRLNIYTYDLGKLLKSFVDEDVAFNFREFFRVNKEGKFLHKEDVRSFLDLICKEDKKSNYPYSKETYRNNFRHSLWMVPGVKEARALSAMLKEHPVFGQFEIVNVAGDGDEEERYEDALKAVEKAITDKPQETYTITLSCGRLTTGVSVPAWTAVFMLAGSFNTSASSYMQTIFRVQTPATINGKIKEECFVFDFAPDRTLKVIAETAKISSKAGKTSSSDRETMGEFLNFCPIISVDGSRMAPYNVNGMLEQLKRVYVERVVRNGFEDGYLYNNDQLMKLDDVELQDFEKLKRIIGSTKAMPKSGDIDINRQGFTDEEYEQLEEAEKKSRAKKELTDEEKRLLKEKEEKRKIRNTAVSILRGISIRMPLLIYGADVTNEDKQINIDNFSKLIDDQSWEEFMPKGVTKDVFENFKKYYEPDVFRAAGKRIRVMARAADNLSIEERIDRITTIFSTFRNPDKETVLTPWRVVNMHMGDCLGGYVFFDEKMENTIEEPRFVNHGEVTDSVFAEDSKILEINSKSGLYPLYMAYGIYRRILDAEYHRKDKTPSIEDQLKIWDKVIADNIFVICKTPMAKSITKRTLIGFREAKVNTRYFKDLLNQITHKQQNFLKKVKQGKRYWKSNNNDNMKFNAIVGNPPYQEMDGGGESGSSAKPIYQHFVNISKKLNPDYISLIMPTRWYSGGKGLDDFRKSMLKDSKIAILHDFLNPEEVFLNTNIRGGICYFLWDTTYNNKLNLTQVVTHNGNGVTTSNMRSLKSEGSDIFIRHEIGLQILEKVKRHKYFKSFEKNVSSRKPFGLDSKFNRSSAFHNSKDGLTNPLICYAKGKTIGYIEKNDFKFNESLFKNYKVLTSFANNIGTELNDDNLNSFIAEPESVCTETYIILGYNLELTEVSANNLSKYFRTKFARFLHSLAKSNQNGTSKTYKFVPLQDFTEKSDIDWSKPIPEIDKQLYHKYDLNEEEINFIESMIKPME
ncbi:MAG TPA: DEAD/DEAH box helicase family protein [Bacteroidales bacterium]|nr:DEAD/DEAH box helicase family protein [Bacteroidales bacterium]